MYSRNRTKGSQKLPDIPGESSRSIVCRVHSSFPRTAQSLIRIHPRTKPMTPTKLLVGQIAVVSMTTESGPWFFAQKGV